MAISFVGTRYGRLSSSLEGRALWDELADFLGGLTDLDQLFGVMVRASILRAWYSGYETVQVFDANGSIFAPHRSFSKWISCVFPPPPMKKRSGQVIDFATIDS